MPAERISKLAAVSVLLILCMLTPASLGQVQADSADGSNKDLIFAMLEQVDSDKIRSYLGDLSGAWPAVIGDQAYTISTRHALSGEPIQKAGEYLYQFYENLGLQVQYHSFSYQGQQLNNIAAQQAGSVFPERVFLVTSHFDDIPTSGPAPGADDNASGTSAVMVTAEILSQYDFGCTLRYVNFGAEEYGMIGSKAYAQQSYCSGENIQGIINLDMIAWNTPESSPGMDLHSLSSIPGSGELAAAFQEVVSEFDLNLVPETADPVTTRSDHASFWKYGYPAILVTEDIQDFNPNYHTAGDDLESLPDFGYLTSIIKASLGTAAQAGCLVDEGWGTISGQVIDSLSGEPVPGASLWLYNPAWDYTQFTRSDQLGSFQFFGLSGWHRLSADGLGYAHQEADILLVRDQVQEADFELTVQPENAFYLPFSTNVRHAPLPGCP